MVSFPHCKINLGLHVVARREDGFHDLETCFYPVPCTDILEILPAQKTNLFITGLALPGPLEENLCLRAYELLKKDFPLPPVQIHLHKILPVEAGLGGGSSDAAYTLKTLDQIFNLQLPADRLAAYAAKLGSDCAFFLHDRPMIGKGRGELLTSTSVSLKGKFLLLVKPAESVSTASAFAGLKLSRPAHSIEKIVASPLHQWKVLLKNDFEETVFHKIPAIRLLKEKMYSLGAIYAAMTGSGSAVYGIFENAIALPADWKSLFHWSGTLRA